MAKSRRDFLQQVALGAAAAGVAPATLLAHSPSLSEASASVTSSASEWDTSWTKKLTQKHRAIFDVPEVESSFGVWRATIWENQFAEVFGLKPAQIKTVLVLRHNGILLAMQQAYWDEYNVGSEHRVTHPVTQQGTARNPALLTSKTDEFPANFDAFALPATIQRGTIVLGCNLAFEFQVVPTIQKKDGVTAEAARAKGRKLLVPGVLLQPSGVFAAVLAQDAGCHYVRAS